MTKYDDHTRFDAGLTDDLLDLLSEDERERFHAHARGCERCTRRLAIACTTRLPAELASSGPASTGRFAASAVARFR